MKARVEVSQIASGIGKAKYFGSELTV